MKNTFFVVTPCFNAEKYIEETILSVIQQSVVVENKVDLQYWVIDGGSTDNTIQILEKFKAHGKLDFITEKDMGMYDALGKGFAKVPDRSICAYINAGDLFAKDGFSIVNNIFDSFPAVKWFTGIATLYNEKSQIIRFDYPFKYRQELIQQGFYGPLLPFIQQESTFWRSELMRSIDWHFLASLKLAGDAYIWHQFSRVANLYVVLGQVGGFKLHYGQLSEQLQRYKNERKIFTESKTIKGLLRYAADRLIWGGPLKYKMFLNKQMIFFDLKRRAWILREDECNK